MPGSIFSLQERLTHLGRFGAASQAMATTIICLALALVAVPVMAFLALPGGESDNSLVGPIVMGTATLLACLFIPGLLWLSVGVGWLSGYRSFRYHWAGLNSQEANRWVDRLEAAGLEAGGEVVRRVKAVDGTNRRLLLLFNRETGQLKAVHGAEDSPVSALAEVRNDGGGGYRLDLTVYVPTTVIWDSGERRRCERIGRALVAAEVPFVQPPAHAFVPRRPLEDPPEALEV